MSNAVAGFSTTSKTRPLIIAKMEEFIRNKLITLRSSRLINEFKTFIWHNNKAEAMRSYHDDLVMALAIACWVRDTALEVNQKDLEYKKAIINSMQISKATLHTTIPGMQGHRSSKTNEMAAEYFRDYEKYSWLYKG